MNEIIRIEHLSRRFGEIQAVDDLSFAVRKGELFAFLGANGAGKSTTINILSGQLAKDSGRVLVDGLDIDAHPRALKQRLGVVFQSSVLDRPLTVRDNLLSRGALYGLHGEALQARIAEVSALLELEPLLKRPLGRLSGGQRRRIDLARALLHRPEVLILDEPTTGLDPSTRRMLWDVIARLRRDTGLTVFLTTHYMEEAAEADNVIILDRGRIAAQGTPHELKNAYTGDFITLYGAREEEVRALGLPFEQMRDGIRLSIPSTREATALILKSPSLFTDYEITKGKMDDVFLAVTGKKLTEEEEK